MGQEAINVQTTIKCRLEEKKSRYYLDKIHSSLFLGVIILGVIILLFIVPLPILLLLPIILIEITLGRWIITLVVTSGVSISIHGNF